MIAPLLILVAHGLDGLTFLWAVELWGLSGESNPLMREAVFAVGLLGAMVLKAGGAAIAARIVHSSRHWSTEGLLGGGVRLRSPMLLFAAAAGVLGAASNLTAVVLA